MVVGLLVFQNNFKSIESIKAVGLEIVFVEVILVISLSKLMLFL